MINLTLQLLATQLNQYLKRAYDLSEDVVVLSNLLDIDGNVPSNVNNKMVIFLTNIEKDATSSRQITMRATDQQIIASSPPLYLNLYVMMVANFSGNNYPEALKFMSSTISFFQRYPLFNHQTTPDLDKRIEKLILDIENLTIQDISNVWSALGGKYLPSILYKVRMITFDAEEIIRKVPVVKESSSSMTPSKQ